MIVEDQSAVEAFKDFTLDDAGGVKAPAKPAEEQKPEEKPAEQPKPEEKPPAPTKEVASKKEETATDFSGPIHASPIARRLALERGIPLQQIKGSGPGGRIIKADIENYTSPTVVAPAAGLSAYPGEGYTDIPLTGMRRTIAKRLSESMFTAPHYYITSSINMTKMLKLRKALNDAAPLGKDGKPVYKLSVNDLIVKGVGCALARVPEANSQWMEKEGVLRLYSYVDISVLPLLAGVT